MDSGRISNVNPDNFTSYTQFTEESTADDLFRESYGTEGEKYLKALFDGVAEFNKKNHEEKASIQVDEKRIYVYSSKLTTKKVEEILELGKNPAWRFAVNRIADNKIQIKFFSLPYSEKGRFFVEEQPHSFSKVPEEIWGAVKKLNERYLMSKPVKELFMCDGSSYYDPDKHTIYLAKSELGNISKLKDSLIHEYGHAVFACYKDLKTSSEWKKIYLASTFCFDLNGENMLSQRYDESNYEEGADKSTGHPYSKPSELFASVFHAFYGYENYLRASKLERPEQVRLEDNIIQLLKNNQIFEFLTENKPSSAYSDAELIEMLYQNSQYLDCKDFKDPLGDMLEQTFVGIVRNLDVINIDGLTVKQKEKLSFLFYNIITKSLYFFLFDKNKNKEIIESMLEKNNYAGLNSDQKDKIKKKLGF